MMMVEPSEHPSGLMLCFSASSPRTAEVVSVAHPGGVGVRPRDVEQHTLTRPEKGRDPSRASWLDAGRRTPRSVVDLEHRLLAQRVGATSSDVAVAGGCLLGLAVARCVHAARDIDLRVEPSVHEGMGVDAGSQLATDRLGLPRPEGHMRSPDAAVTVDGDPSPAPTGVRHLATVAAVGTEHRLGALEPGIDVAVGRVATAVTACRIGGLACLLSGWLAAGVGHGLVDRDENGCMVGGLSAGVDGGEHGQEACYYQHSDTENAELHYLSLGGLGHLLATREGASETAQNLREHNLTIVTYFLFFV
jgi:hypothetical protein